MQEFTYFYNDKEVRLLQYLAQILDGSATLLATLINSMLEYIAFGNALNL